MLSQELVWNPAPEKLTLGYKDIHVWRASLNQTATAIAAFRRVLAPDELERAAKYHFQKDCERFISARAVLRLLLASYLGREPAGLRFRTNAYGKPELDARSDEDTLRFNLSHARDIALYAIARKREIGVDVEYVSQDFDTEQIASRFFSRREVQALRALPASLRTESFFRCWTRKEAYIKAKGEGLSMPLDQFDVSLSPDAPAALLNVASDPAEITRWSLRELTPATNYIAAIAVEGHDWQLRCFQWVDKQPDAVVAF